MPSCISRMKLGSKLPPLNACATAFEIVEWLSFKLCNTTVFTAEIMQYFTMTLLSLEVWSDTLERNPYWRCLNVRGIRQKVSGNHWTKSFEPSIIFFCTISYAKYVSANSAYCSVTVRELTIQANERHSSATFNSALLCLNTVFFEHTFLYEIHLFLSPQPAFFYTKYRTTQLINLNFCCQVSSYYKMGT